MFCPLGVGTLDIKAILDVLKDAPQDIDYAIECDGWSGDAGEGAKISAEYLKEYGF